MKLNTQTLQLLSACGLLFQGAVADSGFFQKCNSIEVDQPGIDKAAPPHAVLMTGNCQESSGIFNVDTTIDLNICITNSDGQTFPVRNGDFGASCFNLFLDGSVLHCTCPDDNGNEVQTVLDLDDFIGVDSSGRMTCFGSPSGP